MVNLSTIEEKLRIAAKERGYTDEQEQEYVNAGLAWHSKRHEPRRLHGEKQRTTQQEVDPFLYSF